MLFIQELLLPVPKSVSIISSMICKVCTKNIEPERLSILPNTVFCAPCAQLYSKVKPNKGIMVFDHKTGGTLCTMSADYYDNNKQYFVPNSSNRRSVMKNFSKNICS